MEKICEFTINNKVYSIYDVYRITGKKSYVGRSDYEDKTIYVECNSYEQMMYTLIHELMHVWLYENGHTNQDGTEVFSYEDLCEYTALAYLSIERIVNLYLNSKKHIEKNEQMCYIVER